MAEDLTLSYFDPTSIPNLDTGYVLWIQLKNRQPTRPQTIASERFKIYPRAPTLSGRSRTYSSLKILTTWSRGVGAFKSFVLYCCATVGSDISSWWWWPAFSLSSIVPFFGALLGADILVHNSITVKSRRGETESWLWDSGTSRDLDPRPQISARGSFCLCLLSLPWYRQIQNPNSFCESFCSSISSSHRLLWDLHCLALISAGVQSNFPKWLKL